MSDYKTYQGKLLHIVLNDISSYSDFVLKVPADIFDTEYRPIAQGIHYASVNEMVLTPTAYEDYIKTSVNNGEYQKWSQKDDCPPTPTSLGEKRKFTSVQKLDNVSSDELGFLINKVREYHDRVLTEKALTEFKEKSNGNFYEAMTVFAEKARGISSSGEKPKLDFSDIATASADWLVDLKDRRANKRIPLETGFADVDEVMGVGLDPGSLTFFVADVGGFKTTMMLNIALNVFKKTNENVMFVSLEMPRDLVIQKIVARESGISQSKMQKPHLLSDLEMEKIERELDKWNNNNNKFVIIDAVDGVTVADIASLIENHSGYYVPRVVVIDYLTILTPEPWYARLPQHAWYGYMCKSIRNLGKKHNFAIVSAAQLGREALKRLKGQKEGAQSVGSEDVRGSHDLSADADNMFILYPVPSQPKEKLQLFCAKARYGDKSFGGKGSATLTVNGETGKMSGDRDATWNAECATLPSQVALNYDQSIDINVDIPNNIGFDFEFDEEPEDDMVASDDMLKNPDDSENDDDDMDWI